MYNVLEKLRSGEALNAKDKVIHEQGLVSVLKKLHDDLDAAVFDGYGWPHDLSDEQILERRKEEPAAGSHHNRPHMPAARAPRPLSQILRPRPNSDHVGVWSEWHLDQTPM